MEGEYTSRRRSSGEGEEGDREGVEALEGCGAVHGWAGSMVEGGCRGDAGRGWASGDGRREEGDEGSGHGGEGDVCRDDGIVV